MKSDIQIANRNEKLDTMLSQVNASQDPRQTIGNNHMISSLLTNIITERFDNTLKDQSTYYHREASKKECQEETITK